MLVKARNFSPRELERFGDLQRLSFRILEESAASLTAGDTEKSVARRLVRRYRVMCMVQPAARAGPSFMAATRLAVEHPWQEERTGALA